jgi:Lipocalin-like domain
MVKRCGPPSQGWRTFLRNHAPDITAMDLFGTYSVSEADRTIAIHIEGSSFPNWNGADQKRLFVFSGDELKLISPAASGAGTAEVVWKRAK